MAGGRRKVKQPSLAGSWYGARIQWHCSQRATRLRAKNRPPGESPEPAAHFVRRDALALVRFGLRAPDDLRILNSLKVIDALLKVETPYGPACHSYNHV